MAKDPYEEFRRAVACPDQKIELARAALTIAAGEYPNLLIAEYLSRIDLLAAEVAERIGQERNVYRSIAGLNHVLFQRHGYRGNRSEYFDPKNSFLNRGHGAQERDSDHAIGSLHGSRTADRTASSWSRFSWTLFG